MKKLKRFNSKNYVPFKDEMYRDRMLMRIMAEKSFKLCFKRDISDNFFKSLERIYAKDRPFVTNTIIQVNGLTGTSKSLNIMTLAKSICPNFNQENIYFFDQEVLDNLKEVNRDTILIKDENPAKAIFGQGSNRIQNQLEVVADTSRKLGISLIFVEPRFRQNDIAKWYLETIDIGYIKEGRKKYRVNRMGVREPITLNFIGSIYLGVLDEKDKDWIKYNKRKDEFMKQVKDGEFKDAKMNYETIAEEILNEMDLDLYKTQKAKKLFVLQKYPNLTNQEIDMILEAIKIYQNKI